MILEDEIMAFLDRPGLVGKKYKFSVLKNKFCSKEGYSPSELRDVLAKLEVEGKVLITERDEISSFAPSSKFFTGVIKISKYNEGTITHDGKVYKVKVDDGEFVNIGSKDNKDLDQFSDFGLSNAGGAVWTNKPVAQITIADGAASLTIHNMDNGYSIWIYGARLIRAAA